MSKLTCFISKFLNTDDIDRFAKKNKVIAPYYLGCYPANVKPDNVNQHCCWVWNVDERDKPRHTLGLRGKERQGYFFFLQLWQNTYVF